MYEETGPPIENCPAETMAYNVGKSPQRKDEQACTQDEEKEVHGKPVELTAHNPHAPRDHRASNQRHGE